MFGLLGIALLGFVLVGHLGKMLKVLTAVLLRVLWANPTSKEQEWQVWVPSQIQKQVSHTGSGADTSLKQMKGRDAS